MAPFYFSPKLELDPAKAPITVRVKGEVPHHDYPFTLLQLYPTVGSCGAKGACRRISGILKRLDKLLSKSLNVRATFQVPEVATDQEAIGVMKALFDPGWHSVDTVVFQPYMQDAGTSDHLFQLEHVKPFPLELASHQKLLHTLVWIDTNIKLKVERTLVNNKISVAAVREIVLGALTIYCLVVKMQDYRLALSINFNHSIFLQDRILHLIFGDALYFGGEDSIRVGSLSNEMALGLLKELGALSYRQICSLSVFMGVVWTGKAELQCDFTSCPKNILAKLTAQLEQACGSFCIDHIDHFLADLGKDISETITVILDDNGESVFDLALFQRLLRTQESFG